MNEYADGKFASGDKRMHVTAHHWLIPSFSQMPEKFTTQVTLHNPLNLTTYTMDSAYRRVTVFYH
jgi:hypothetical protein